MAASVDPVQVRGEVQSLNYVLPEMVGRRIEIVGVRFVELQGHVAMIGKCGVVSKAIASRNVYVIDLADGGRWESLPSNIRFC